MKLWTVQTPEVLKLLEDQGVTTVKREHILKKYGDCAWSFLIAYDFMTERLRQKVPQPKDAESPVWFFTDPRWAGEGAVAMEVPEEEVILFDLRKWYRVLSLSYVGTEQEEKFYDEQLHRMGIRDSSDVFRGPFYPLQKRQITASWDRIFDLPEDRQFYQAACWQLKKEWKR